MGEYIEKYIVNVGNIGNIPEPTKAEARKTYNEYVRQSKSGFGRGGEEDVTLIINGEPVREFSFTGWMVARLTGQVETAKGAVKAAERSQGRAQGRLEKYLQSLEGGQ